ncbi:MAG: hypothetical protein EXS09_08350 [Gemmataceae bacterium]|nr:hypothetical protein [Gemmataceae bacterium]
MRPNWNRIFKHSVLVGVALAIVGSLLGKAFLIVHQMYSGGAYNPENERVLWQTPVVMATLGILMTVGIDLVTGMFRKPVPASVSPLATNPGS